MCDFNLFIGIILTISVIVAFVLLIVTCSLLKYNPESLEKYKDNWSKTPIKEIKIIDDNKCPINYVPLINTTFYGTIDHCNCTYSNSKKYKGKNFPDVCEKEYGETNCTTIIGQNKTLIHKWRKKIICVQHMDSTKYNYNKFIKNNNCVSNISVDSQNNSFCNDGSTQIPISYLVIKKKYESSDIPCEDLDDEYKICYSKNNNKGFIIVDVKISQDKDGICVSDNEGIFSQNSYEFNRKKGSSLCSNLIGGNKIDSRYYKIDNDSYNYIQLLKDHEINKYSYLNLSENDSVSLYAVSYFGIKEKCFKERQIVDVLFEKKITAVQVLCIFSCVFSASLAIFTTISSITEDWSSDTDGVHKFFCGFIGILLIIAEIILFVRTSEQSNLYDCFDQITFVSYWEMYWHIWISKILIGIIIAIYTINVIYPSYMSELF